MDLLLNRRSIRSYQKKQVEQEKIHTILAAALTSPSGRNLKPWEIIVVEDRLSLERLAGSRGVYSQFIKDAPLAFVIIAQDQVSTTWISDASIVALIIQLTGESLGLKSCWVHCESREADDGSDMEENVRKILDIPGDYRILSMVSMGYPQEEKPAYQKEELDYSKIHYEKFKE